MTAPRSASVRPVAATRAASMQAGEDAVAGRAVVEHDDVAGLLAAERVPARAHLLEHVAVADRGLAHLDALALHRLEQAEVAHDRGDEGVVRRACRAP